MAAFNFPNSPSTNDLHTENSVTWKWDGVMWNRVGPAYTDTTNLNVTGIGTFAGNVHVGGVLTYEDVKNVDSVGIITARTGLNVTAGDVVIPDTIVHAGDSNTKIRFPAADTFSVETAGQQNVQVNGTRVFLKSPSGTDTTVRLQHQGNSGYGDIILDRTVNAFIISNDPSNASNNQSYFSVKNKGTENLRIASDGQLRIGTTSTGTASVVIDSALGNGSVLRFIGKSANDGSEIDFYANNNSTRLGYIEFNDEVTKIVSETDVPFKITTNGASNERLRITSDGKIGVGIASPVGTFEIRDSKANLIVAKDGLTVKGNNDIHTTYDLIQLGAGGGLASYSSATVTADTHLVHNAYRSSGGAWQYKYADTAMRLRMNSPGGAFIFDSAASGSAGATVSFSEKLRITAGGYVGVKRSTPLANLHTTNNELAIGNNPTSAAAPNATYDGLVVDGEAASFINIRSRGNGSDSYGRLAFSDDVRSRAYVEYRHKDGGGDDTMRFATAGSERLRIDSSGKIGIGIAASPYLDKVCIKNDVSAGTHNWALHLLNGTHAADSRVGLAFQANNNNASNTWDGAGIYASNDGSTGACHTMFGTVIDGSFTERVRITSGGQLIQTTTHTSGNSAHQNTSWYGDDANEYAIEIRDFNEMYAEKTHNSNSYNSIVYKREKMTTNCDIEFTLAGAHDSSGSGYMHLGMPICGDGSDTSSNWDRLVFRSHGSNSGLNEIRTDKGGGGNGFDYVSSSIPTWFDGTERHIQIKIRGRRYSFYSDGVEIYTTYANADSPRTHGFFGFIIYEASSVNPWIKIRDFKIQNYSLNTSLPSWDVVKSVPPSTNNAYHYTVTDLNNPRTVEIRFWRLRHSGGTGRMYLRLGPSSGYITSGYYDIGTYRLHSDSGATIARNHNQGQWTPLHYDFNNPTNYYSGCITIRRISNSGRNTRLIYESSLVVDYDSGNSQYYNNCAGQMAFANSNPWDRLTFYNANTSAVLNYGELEILAQH